MGRNWWKKKYEQEMILSRHQPEGPFSYVLVLDHLKPGFNVGKIIRTASALGCRELHFVAIGMFDPGPAKGSLKQIKSRSFERFEESYRLLESEGYEVFALDHAAPGALHETRFPEKAAFILGHEEYGLSFKAEEFPKIRRISIAQFGQVQSLNVSIASALVSYEYLRQHGLLDRSIDSLNESR